MADNDTDNVKTVVTQEVSTNIPKEDCTIFGVSVRAWLVVMLVGTLCVATLGNPILSYLITGDIMIEIHEPFYSAVVISLGYYFGQSKKI